MNILKDIKNKREITSWMFYDWANSAFATVMMAAILPVYYSDVAAGSLSANTASSYWGYTNTIAMLVIAFLAPVLGAISDIKHKKLKFLKFFLFLGVISSALMFFIESGHWFYASLLYILGRIGFSGGNLFYDSFLPHIVVEKHLDRVSTLGYALGYLGGGLLLAFNLSMILSPEIYGLQDSQIAIRLSFVSVAIWWAVFSLPLLRNVSEPIPKVITENRNSILFGFKRVIKTLKEIKKFKQVFMFLLAFWLYNDGIGTIMVMAVIFGKEIGNIILLTKKNLLNNLRRLT